MMLTIEGETNVIARFNVKAARVADVSPAAPYIVAVFRKAAADTFNMMGERGEGEAWIPDTYNWMSWKINHGYDPRTEFMTHALYKSLTAGGVVRISRSSVTLGSGVRYARYQTRKLIKLTAMERNEIRQIWFDYIAAR